MCYLLHAVHGLLQEVELVLMTVLLFRVLHFSLLLFQQFHLIPVGIQLPSQTVILLSQAVRVHSQSCIKKEEEKRLLLEEYRICKKACACAL